MIELQSVSKKFGTAIALHETDLCIGAGKTTVLIGPSGCGKSTILRLIIGLLEPTTGTIVIEGQPVSASNILSLRRRIGYVIQEGGLFAHLTAAQNVLLMAKHLNQPRGQMQTRLHELCELTHLPENALTRYPVELSGGQRQRVSLMRALMLEPSVLLLDEPLGALDPMVRARLQDELKEIFQRLRQTIVLVTHDRKFPRETPWKIAENTTLKWGSPPPEHMVPLRATFKWLKCKHLRHESFYVKNVIHIVVLTMRRP
jgi:osmoprotectant transport system ATP-binding protein